MQNSNIRFSNIPIHAAKELVTFWKSSFIQAYKDVHSPENMEIYFAENYTIAAAEEILGNKNYHCSFAKRGNKNIGVSIIRDRSCTLLPKLNSSELKHLYVLSTEYHSGLGKMILENVFQTLHQNKKEYLWLCVSDRNLRAQNFYRKFNFKVVGKGPILNVGTDALSSSIMIRSVVRN